MKWNVVVLVTVLGVGTAAAYAQGSRSVWDGVYTETQASSGERQYAASCASCHGGDLGGGEMAPALTGGEFKSNWDSVVLQDLLERIYRTMPQNAPQSLTRQQSADILAYVLKKGGYPPGHNPLPSESQALSSTTLLADKP
jgi:mono/diheme cytochrome c family protein